MCWCVCVCVTMCAVMLWVWMLHFPYWKCIWENFVWLVVELPRATNKAEKLYTNWRATAENVNTRVWETDRNRKFVQHQMSRCAGRNYRMRRMKASILKCRPLLNSSLIVFNAIKFVMDARRERIIVEMLLLFRINFRNDLKGLKSKRATHIEALQDVEQIEQYNTTCTNTKKFMSNEFDFDLYSILDNGHDTHTHSQPYASTIVQPALVYILMCVCDELLNETKQNQTKHAYIQLYTFIIQTHVAPYNCLCAMLANNLHHSTRKQMIALYILCSTDYNSSSLNQ